MSSLHAKLAQYENKFSGELSFDAEDLQRHSTDASIYFLKPQGILYPENLDDLQTALLFCKENGIALTCRGAGTSTAGQAIGEGLIVDFSRHMQRIVSIDLNGKRVEIEPGLVYEKLNQSLTKEKLFFPVNPSSGKLCTLGGMIANNASGPYSLKYGATKDNVLNLKVLLADGRLIDSAQPPPDISAAIKKMLARYIEEIQAYKPRTAVNSSGYNVWDVFKKGDDLTPLFVGSEGSLGIVLTAQLQLQDLPDKRSAALIGFRNFSDAAAILEKILNLKPTALEFLDREVLAVMRLAQKPTLEEIPESVETLLIVEFDDKESAMREKKLAAAQHQAGSAPLVFQALVHIDHFWELRRKASPLLQENATELKPLRFIEDAAVPLSQLATYLSRLKLLLQDFGTTGATFGHAGNGHIHVNPWLNPTLDRDRRRLRQIMEAHTALVIELKGTISGEHGDGLLRTAAMRTQFGPLVVLFEELKRFFDPTGILNPGKILNADPEAPFRHWRFEHEPLIRPKTN